MKRTSRVNPPPTIGRDLDRANLLAIDERSSDDVEWGADLLHTPTLSPCSVTRCSAGRKAVR